MQRRIRQSVWKRLSASVMWRVAGVVLIIFFGWIVAGELKSYRQLQREIKQTESAIRETSERSRELKQLIGYFEESAFIEKLARERQQMKREGEQVAVIHYVEPADRGQLAPAGATLEKPNIEQWLKVLFPPREGAD